MRPAARAALVAAALLLASVALASSGLIEQVQDKYLRTSSIKASFVQKTASKAMMVASTARGTVFIKKPGKMRWDYDEPEVQSFVSNGSDAWLVSPAERRIYLYKAQSALASKTALMFLAGSERLDRHFSMEVAKEGKESFTLELVPKERLAGVMRMSLRVLRRGLFIRSVTTVDRLGNTNTLTFSRITENGFIPDSMFKFEVPEGFTVERQRLP